MEYIEQTLWDILSKNYGIYYGIYWENLWDILGKTYGIYLANTIGYKVLIYGIYKEKTLGYIGETMG